VIDIKMIHNTHWNHCKASLTSKDQYRPHSFLAMLFLVAGIGPSSIINGSLPTTAPILIIALGFNPSFSPTSLEPININEAPSTSPEELPMMHMIYFSMAVFISMAV
jgi:hypothetical protein